MKKKCYISNSFVTWAKRRNIPVTYKTVVLVPYYDGYKNVLTQDMLNEENVKYVIKYDYWLNGETITVPENSILEFDGGSLHDGTIIGQDTFINDIGGLGLEKLFAEDIVREGTWRISGEQVQSDWNQNDNTKPDFIKNKPSIDAELSETSTNPVQNSVITKALEKTGNMDKSYDPDAHSGLGRKNLELGEDGSNVLNQEDFDSENTIYVIKYDFDLGGETIEIPACCVLEFDGGSLSNGSLVLQNTLFDGVVKIGGDLEISGTCANQTAYQSWFVDNDIDAWHRFINTVDGVSVYEYTKGVFDVTETVDKQISNVIVVNGNGAELHFNENANVAYRLSSSNFIKGQALLEHDVLKDDISISKPSDFSCNKNDTIIIMDKATASFNPLRRYYMQGEVLNVKEVTDGTITFSSQILGNYKHSANGNVKIYNVSFADVSVNNIILLSDRSNTSLYLYGLVIEGATACVKNVVSKHFSTSILMENCYNTTVNNSIGIGFHVVGIDGYGISVGNSQNVKIIGGEYSGKNHGVSFGGDARETNIVCRSCLIENVKAYSYEFGYGIDAHDNSEYLTVKDCVVDGIILNGNYCNIINNYVKNKIRFGSFCGNTHNIIGNVCKNMLINLQGFNGTNSHGGTFENYTPPSGKELLCIKNNIIKENFDFGFYLPFSQYENISNLECIFDSCRLQYISGYFLPYMKDTFIETSKDYNIDKGGRVTVTNCDLMYSGSAYTEFVVNKIDIINSKFESTTNGKIAIKANDISIVGGTINKILNDKESSLYINVRKKCVIKDATIHNSLQTSGFNIESDITAIEKFMFIASCYFDISDLAPNRQIINTSTNSKICLFDNIFNKQLSSSLIINGDDIGFVTYKGNIVKDGSRIVLRRKTNMLNLDVSPINFLGTTEIPNNIYEGYTVLNGNKHQIDTWLNGRMVEYDKATSGVKRSGNTASRPIGSDIYVGFMYMDTTLGKPVYAKAISDDTVTWVDATGATV